MIGADIFEASENGQGVQILSNVARSTKDGGCHSQLTQKAGDHITSLEWCLYIVESSRQREQEENQRSSYVRETANERNKKE